MARTTLAALFFALLLSVGCDGSLADIDHDGTPTAVDNCPLDFNAEQADTDGDGLGDVCDWGHVARLFAIHADADGYRYRIRAEFPLDESEVEAVAFSIESYVPATIESDFFLESIAQTPLLFPPMTATFAAYNASNCEQWEDCVLIHAHEEERTIDLGVIIFEHPQPPPEISFHGSTNVPGFEWGAVWYDAPSPEQTIGGTASTGAGDLDRDGVAEDIDNCQSFYNPSQRDADDDGWGDICDFNAADPVISADPATGSVVETP